MKSRKKIGFLLLFLAITFLLLSCDNKKNFKDLKEYLAKIKQAAVVDKEKSSITPLKFPALVSYTAGKLRAPFDHSLAQPGEKNNVNNPLQSYPLSMLRLVGVLSKNNIFYAYILAPDKIVYEVKIEDVIGDHYGKIVKISPNQLEIIEQDSDNKKLNTGRIVTLQLKDEQ